MLSRMGCFRLCGCCGKGPGWEEMWMIQKQGSTVAGKEALNDVKDKLFTRCLLKTARQTLYELLP